MQSWAVCALLLLACGPSTRETTEGGDDDGDGGLADAGVQADAADCVSLACGAQDLCFDGIDNDCNGAVDDGCPCTVGTTARCLPPGEAPTESICNWGAMSCVANGEFGAWADCQPPSGGTGAGLYGCRRIGVMGQPGANPSSNFQQWLTMQGAIVTRFHADETHPTLTREELETYDLVIVDYLRSTYTLEESQTLAQWVKDGGALMFMAGHDDVVSPPAVQSLLSGFGPSYDQSIILNSEPGPPATLLAHPTTSDGMGGTLPPIIFAGGYAVVVPSDLQGSLVPIAMLGDQVVGVAGEYGSGRLLIWGDEWIEFDSEWSTMPAIPQFWLDVVTWLNPDPGTPICMP